jgi:hypothetical protein
MTARASEPLSDEAQSSLARSPVDAAHVKLAAEATTHAPLRSRRNARRAGGTERAAADGGTGGGSGGAGTPRRGPKILLVIALIAVALAIAVGALALSHGRGTTTPPAGTAAGSSPATSSKPSSAPPDLPLTAFDASAPLQKNVDLFNRTATAVAASANPLGVDFTNALAAVGFDKSAMQITADRTTINAVAPAIVFAVKVDGKCLLGQYTPSNHEYDHQVVSPISTGSCLIGEVSPAQ